MIEYTYEDLFKENSTDKQFTIEVEGTGIVIDNTMISSESIKLEESLCSSTSLEFGACEASKFTCTIHNVVSSLIDKWLTVKITLAGNTDEPFILGRYKVASDTPTADRTNRDIVAYDALYDVINDDVASWYNGLEFPMTLKTFRDSFFSHEGITQENTSLVNDSMTVEKTITTTASSDDGTTSVIGEGLSGKDVITAICEANGVFGHINHLGQFIYKQLKANTTALFPSDDLYPDAELFPSDWGQDVVNVGNLYKNGTVKYEDYSTERITGLTIATEENDIGVTVGSNTNVYSITGNFLFYGKGESYLKNIAVNLLSVISIPTYQPFSCTMRANPCIEVGDIVRLSTTTAIISSYVLKRSISGLQALVDDIESQGERYTTVKTNGTQAEILQLKGKANILTRTIDETQSTLKDVSEGLQTQITQTADSITLEATKRESEDSELSSRIAMTYKDIDLSVTNGEKSAQLTLTATREDGTKITASSDTIELSGNVVFKSNLTDGSTTISGDNITTGTINCDLLNGGTIKGQTFTQQISKTSSVTGEVEHLQLRIDGTYIYLDYLDNNGNITNTQYIMYFDESRNGYYPQLLDTDIHRGYLMNCRIPANTPIYLDTTGQNGGQLFTEYNGNDFSDGANYAVFQGCYLLPEDGTCITQGSGGMYLNGKDYDGVAYNNVAQICRANVDGLIYAVNRLNSTNSGLYPSVDNNTYLGFSGHRFKELYATNATIQTSDRNYKKDISYMSNNSDEFTKKFVEGLKPVTYKMVDGDTGRPHHGFIAQDVEELLKDIGKDHACFIKSPKTKTVKGANGEATEEIIENEYIYSLRYDEIIADLTRYIQLQNERINALEADIKELKGEA